MKAMILAAGLGTRLRPLTNDRPKALVPVCNIPMIDRAVDYLKGQGAGGIIVNAHHHAGQVVAHLNGKRPSGMDMRVKVEQEILGTAGGIKNTEGFWDDESLVVMNVDILTDIDLGKAFEAHRLAGTVATLVLHDYGPFNQVLIDENCYITDIGRVARPGRLAFTGIHILRPEILSHIPQGRFSSIIDCYLKLIGEGIPVGAWVSEGHYWRDVGTVESYISANREALGEAPFLAGPGCRIHPSARFADWAVMGGNVIIEEDVEICRSVLWEGVRVRRGVRVVDSVVTSQKEAGQDLDGGVL